MFYARINFYTWLWGALTHPSCLSEILVTTTILKYSTNVQTSSVKPHPHRHPRSISLAQPPPHIWWIKCSWVRMLFLLTLFRHFTILLGSNKTFFLICEQFHSTIWVSNSNAYRKPSRNDQVCTVQSSQIYARGGVEVGLDAILGDNPSDMRWNSGDCDQVEKIRLMALAVVPWWNVSIHSSSSSRVSLEHWEKIFCHQRHHE